MKNIKAKDGRTYRRASRWIRIRFDYVTMRHSLSAYADFSGTDDETHGLLIWFRHGGRSYALGQFMRLSYPIFYEDENGKESFLSGYDSENWYRPYLIELDDGGEYCRLYEEIQEEEER